MNILLSALILDEIIGIVLRIGSFLLFLVGLYLWGYVGTFLHEVTHILIGSILGYVPYRVEIGHGKGVLYSRTIRGIEFLVYEMPFGGRASFYVIPYAENRWKEACMLGAGIIADISLTLVLVTWLLLGVMASLAVHPVFKVLLIPNILLLLYHFYDTIRSLFPSTGEYQGETLPNDIKQVFRCLFRRTDLDEEWQSQIQLDRDAYQHRRSLYDPTSYSTDKFWFEAADDVTRLQYAIASIALQQQHYAAAVKIYRKVLQSGCLPPLDKAMILDTLASLPVVYGVNAYRKDALVWIEEAQRLAPSAQTLRGTYGALLIENGQIEQGITLLTPLVAEGNHLHDQEISAYYLAKAYYALGDHASAKQWLEKGRGLGNFKELSSRIEQEMTQ